MQNPSDLYELAEGRSLDDVRASVLVVALGGVVDAGHVQRLITDQLTDDDDGELVASFDLDALYDYRGRRPMMTFESDHFTSYSAPRLELRRLRDGDGTPYLLLAGPEPDYQWDRAVEAIIGLAERLDVSLVASAHGIPMGVPHTRPIGVTAHATNDALLSTADVRLFGSVALPAAFGQLLELRLGERDLDAVGYAVHVPQYLAQIALPDAALVALRRLSGVTGLALPTGELESAAATTRAQLAAEIGERSDAAAMVAALEKQYDELMTGRVRPGLPSADRPPVVEGMAAGDLPSADEIGAEAEAFLRGLGDDSGPED